MYLPNQYLPNQEPYTPEEEIKLRELILSACRAEELIPTDELEDACLLLSTREKNDECRR